MVMRREPQCGEPLSASRMQANDPIVLEFLSAIGVDLQLARSVTVEIEIGELVHVTERRLVRKEQ
jgi:hypothetical protein